ncbi:MAG: NHL repeat-containing protein [Candidatus Sumerlaeaceae bacterium]|nr:NHL repeat-containing protein [Candidatus Sumerlaeaceae bacterium]
MPNSGLAQWSNGQAAEYVIGQPNFTSTASTCTATGVSKCTGVAVDVPNGKLYVADSLNNRVLRFSYPITGNAPAAELVFGQPDFTTSTANNGGIGASSLSYPTGMVVDSTGRLFVCDLNNHRVLQFDSAHTIGSNKPSADRVLGQSSFTAGSSGTSASRFWTPRSVAVDTTGSLYVADFENHRVLRFDSASSKANGASADGVLGQSNFTSNGSNYFSKNATGMANPAGCAVYGGYLYVTEYWNERVLRFDAAAQKSNGGAADGLLGASAFNGSIPAGLGASQFSQSLFGAAVDISGRLYIPDAFDRRLMIFDSAHTKAIGASADNLLGQSSFSNNTNQATQSGCSGFAGVAVDSVNGKVIVGDYVTNHRVLVYSASAMLPVDLSHVLID